MSTTLLTLLTVIWIAWAIQAVLSVLIVRKFIRGYRLPPRKRYVEYCPPAAVIVPFKGMDLDLRANVRALCEQDYPTYRLIFVVESEDDPACPVLREELAKCDRPAELIVAGIAGSTQGQKVHNLIAAVEHLERSAGGEVVWAFADSDAVPGPDWLGALVGPLALEQTGVATGYRWFVPTPSLSSQNERGATVWSHLGSVMNSSVACWAGRNRQIHAWGGSMAIRAETAREGDLLGLWRGALSDDYQMSRLCKQLGRRIYFVHGCLIASPVDFSFRSLWSFVRRQYIITRTHAPGLYAAALIMLSLYVAGFLSAAAALLWFVVAQPGDGRVMVPLLAAATVFVADHLRSMYRRRVIRHAFGDKMVQRMRMTLWIDAHLTPLWMMLHWLIVLSAGVGRTITWRGNRYRIRSPQDIRT